MTTLQRLVHELFTEWPSWVRNVGTRRSPVYMCRFCQNELGIIQRFEGHAPDCIIYRLHEEMNREDAS